MIQDIYIIDDSDEIKSIVDYLFKEDKEYRFKKVTEKQIDVALKNIPSLILINEDSFKDKNSDIYRKIAESDDNRITPVIVVSSNNDRERRIEILKAGVEHFIRKPIDEEDFYYTIINILKLLDINRRVSPLTGLPGNVQIQAEMKKRLLNKEEFSMIYFDLDNFKYIHEMGPDSNFVGHIGGDDFVAIVSGSECEEVCQNIIVEFDKNIEYYYHEKDMQNGYIEVENRKGVLEQFPIVSITIGVVNVPVGKFNNILEIGEVGARS